MVRKLREKKKPVRPASVNLQTKSVDKRRFVIAVEEINKMLSSRPGDFERTYELIRHSVPGIHSRYEIEKYHTNGCESVPLDIYRGAKHVLTTIKGEFSGRGYNGRRCNEAKTLDEWIERMDTVRLGEIMKRYGIKEGYAPYFAVEAFVNVLLEEDKYEDIATIDRTVARMAHTRKGAIENTNSTRNRCPIASYEQLISLAESKEESRFQTGIDKLLIEYRKAGNFKTGQIVIFEDGIGVVLKKLPKNKMEVRMSDGSDRTYVENTFHNPCYTSSCYRTMDICIDFMDEII